MNYMRIGSRGVLSKLNIDQEKKATNGRVNWSRCGRIPGAVRGGYKAYKAYQAKKRVAGETEDDTTGSDSALGADKGGDKRRCKRWSSRIMMSLMKQQHHHHNQTLKKMKQRHQIHQNQQKNQVEKLK